MNPDYQLYFSLLVASQADRDSWHVSSSRGGDQRSSTTTMFVVILRHESAVAEFFENRQMSNEKSLVVYEYRWDEILRVI